MDFLSEHSLVDAVAADVSICLERELWISV
jgi:hypothetical protein